ncbi:MAG TPA: MFS transporter [Acidimicrobiales bacterium]|nr:MFS transporter [Acidimicrobiales bacterium]
MLAGGIATLVVFVVVETMVSAPMFRLTLFRIRPFAAGNAAQFLGATARGGLQFMLMIWFQGIWLPEHGYRFVDTPLWAGIYMIPFSLGFVLSGPVSGWLSDRYEARWFTTGGMLLSASMYLAMMLFPPDFAYWPFAAVMLASGIASGLFASPNTSSIMNSVPARDRGAASGMRVTFNSVGMPLSMGLFFTLLVLGLDSTVPSSMLHGLVANGVPQSKAAALAKMPPLSYLFAAFLGYNPLKSLLGGGVLSHLGVAQAARLTSRSFFPELVAAPFKHGLVLILSFAAAMSVAGALASVLRGERYVHEDAESRAQKAALGIAAPDGQAIAPPGGAALAAATRAGRGSGERRSGVASIPDPHHDALSDERHGASA